jgi:hypothetical protein
MGKKAPAAGRMNEKAFSFVFIAANLGLNYPILPQSGNKGDRNL